MPAVITFDPEFIGSPSPPSPATGPGILSRSRTPVERRSGHIQDARGRPTHGRRTDERYCNQFSPILPNKSPRSADAKLVSSYSCTPSLAHNNLLTSSHDTTRPLSLSPAISKSPDRPLSSSNAAVASPPPPRSCLGPYFQGTAMPSATSEEGGEEVIISPMVFIKSAVGGHSSTEVRTDCAPSSLPRMHCMSTNLCIADC